MTTAHRSGIDLTHLDGDTRAQDDLFVHVNGKWLAEYEIPADRAVDGAFRTLYDKAEEDVQTIITEAAESNSAAGTDAQRIGDLYSSFMDADAVEAAGLSPIDDELDAVADAPDRSSLATVIGRHQRVGVGGAISHYVDTDAKNSERYLIHFSQSGIGLPDESYYREDNYAEIREKYVAHIDKMFTLAGVGYDAQRVFELEKKIAAGHWDVVKRRDADLSYNLVGFEELTEQNPGLDWAAWLSGLGADSEKFAEIVVRQPDFLHTFTALWASESLDDWKAWAAWKVLHARSPYLHSALVDETFAFYGTTLSGTEENRERWKRGVSLVQDLLGEAVGKLYVDRHFPAEAKTRMLELVANLQEAYRRNISDLEWMSPQTREAALAKLEKFTPKIGYPDKWRDYAGLDISATDLVGNYRRGYAAEYDRDLAKLGGPVDRDEWFMTPQTVNAYYNPGMNEIVFPAAILQPPFFDAAADDAANYGGYRRRHRPRDRARLRRSGRQVRRRRQHGRLVDRRGSQRIRQAHKGSHRAVQRVRAQGTAGPPRQRRIHDRREHRRSRRAVDRDRGVQDRDSKVPNLRSSTDSPVCSACSSAGRRYGARRPVRPKRFAVWPSTRTRRRSSGATASSATSTRSTRSSTSSPVTHCIWSRRSV